MMKTRLALALTLSLLALTSTSLADDTLVFNGSSTYVDTKTTPFNGLTNFTIEAWFRSKTIPPSVGGYRYGLIAGGGIIGGTGGFGLYVNGDSYRVSFQLRQPGVASSSLYTPYYFDDLWHHVAVTCGGTNLTMYLDGAAVATGESALAPMDTTCSFTMGMRYADDKGKRFYLNGNIAEVRVWDFARDAAAIANDRFIRMEGDEPGLVGCWPLNEGLGSTATDKASPAHNGTIYNGSWKDDPTLVFSGGDDDFSFGTPFTIANPLTGSLLFTNTNMVDVTYFPIPDGCNAWQITTLESSASINPANWASTNTLPASLTFAQPAASSNIFFYAWFTNTAAHVGLVRSQAPITFTRTAPSAKAISSLDTVINYRKPSTTITSGQINNASSGGTALNQSMAIISRTAILHSGASTNLTPDQPYITLDAPGTYDVRLVVQNEAGNVATSATCTVTVYDDREPNLFFGGSAYVGMERAIHKGLGDFTLETWIRSGTRPAETQYGRLGAIAGQGFLGGNGGFGLSVSGTSDTLSFQLNIAGVSVSTPFAFDNNWHHVAAVRDHTNILLFVDGELTNRRYANTTTVDSKSSFALGGRAADNNTFNFFFIGNIAEVRLWNHARQGGLIRNLMSSRLGGPDQGLIGYWSLEEGTGSYVYDLSGHSITGKITSASWGTSAPLRTALPAQTDFCNALPLTLTDPVSDSYRFTAGTTVSLAPPAAPSGSTHYQITESPATAAVNPAAWLALAAMPAAYSFTPSSGDTNLALSIWYTNMADTAALYRSHGDINFITSPPVASVVTTYERQLVPGPALIVHPEEIDSGTIGAAVHGESVPLLPLSLAVTSHPAADATPDAPFISLNQSGTFDIVLIAHDIIGGISTSAVCQLTVTPWSGDSFTWTGTADNDWHNDRNWSLLAPPCQGADAILTAAESVTLSAPSAGLKSLTLTDATITFNGWETSLNSDNIALNNSTITHPANTAAADDENGEWQPDHRIHIRCHNLTLDATSTIRANSRGFSGGTAANGRGPGGGVRGTSNSGSSSGGGGGHGGHGGNYTGRDAGGPAYGLEKTPLLPGSGGGGRLGLTTAGGAAGGGAILVEARDRLTNHGAITANGGNGSHANTGGGSGGSIWLTCHTIAGNGSITANGGNAGSGSGAGGGGRIAVYCQGDRDAASLTVTANAGDGTNQENLEDGTIYWRKQGGFVIILR